jgi:signal peptidase I
VLSHSARHAVRVTLQLVALLAIAMAFFLRVPQVIGPSMLPHVEPGEMVVINTLAYRLEPPHRGDVVALHHDEATAQTFLKRIVGLPGERVRIDTGVLVVDGRSIPEPYVSFPDKRSVPEVTVPPGDIYVLGDNRAESEDSRTWGPVAERDVIGKALAGLWPPRSLK